MAQLARGPHPRRRQHDDPAARAARAADAARTFERKLREADIAVRLEERYSKQQILNAYLNAVYFGDGYYGVEAASRGYFGKPAADLEPHEAALLAALVRSPAAYSPERRARARAEAAQSRAAPDAATPARLSDADYRAAVDLPLRAARRQPRLVDASAECGRYFQEEVRRQLIAHFGGKQVLRGGLHVYTGYDPAMQCAAEKTDRLAHRADREDAQVGARSARRAWWRWIRHRAKSEPSSAAATSAAPATTARRSRGGSRARPSSRSSTRRRSSAGSRRRRSCTHLDEPIMTDNGPWLPGGEHEEPEYSLRTALKISSNRAAAQLLQQVGHLADDVLRAAAGHRVASCRTCRRWRSAPAASRCSS